MTDERQDAAGSYSLIGALDRLRDDFREDLASSEQRVTTAIAGVASAAVKYQDEHGREHVAMRGDSDAAHKRFDAFMLAQAVAQAKKDGALGVVRFVGDVIGRNWKGLVAIAGGILALAGNVHVDLGVR